MNTACSMQDKFEITGETHAFEAKMQMEPPLQPNNRLLSYTSISPLQTQPQALHISHVLPFSLNHLTKPWGLQSFPFAKFRCAFPHHTWSRPGKKPILLISNPSLGSRGRTPGHVVCSD